MPLHNASFVEIINKGIKNPITLSIAIVCLVIGIIFCVLYFRAINQKRMMQSETRMKLGFYRRNKTTFLFLLMIYFSIGAVVVFLVPTALNHSSTSPNNTIIFLSNFG